MTTAGRSASPTARAALVASAWLLLAACSPTLNWREFMAEGTGVFTSFPCRPDRHSRTVAVAGRSVQMEMLVCEAGGATYALSFFDVREPAQSTSALASLRASMLANVSVPGGAAKVPRVASLQIKGMTPNDQAARVTATGRRPDGGPLTLDAAFFNKGLRIYQAAVVGSAPPDDAAEPFFAGLRFPG